MSELEKRIEDLEREVEELKQAPRTYRPIFDQDPSGPGRLIPNPSARCPICRSGSGAVHGCTGRQAYAGARL